MPPKWSALIVVVAAVLMFPLPAAGAPRPSPGTSARATRINDIDGDGKVDLVLLDPGTGDFSTTDDSEQRRVGGIRILFGDGAVQTISRHEFHDLPVEDSRFGAGLVVGDLNRDGYADIVVSDSSANDYKGVVWAVWGSARGVSARGVQILLEGSRRRPVGAALAFVPVPDPVLAVGTEATDGRPGGVLLCQVTPGGRLGAQRYVTIGSPGIVGSASGGPALGRTLAASNDLLVLGANEAGPKLYGGAVWILQMAGGLTYWAIRVTQDTPGVPGRTETDDNFGLAVSVLDDWVAIAVPEERVRGTNLRGALQPIRVERTGHGLRLHPGRLISRADAPLAAASGPTGAPQEVLITRCNTGYGAILGPGLAPVPLASAAGCTSETLGTGAQSGIVRTGTGAEVRDQPAVVEAGGVIVGWAAQRSTYDAGSSDAWDVAAARLAPPAA